MAASTTSLARWLTVAGLFLLLLLAARAQAQPGVGVGLTSPTQALDVNGGLLVRGYRAVSQPGAYLQWNRSASDGETWLLNQKGASPTGGIRFGGVTIADAVSEYARFLDNGYLGLGTPSPGQRLDVLGVGRFTADGPGLQLRGLGAGSQTYLELYPNGAGSARQAYLGFPNNGSTALALVNENTAGDLVAQAGRNVRLNVGSSTQLLVSAGGVGIGTSSPGAALDVASPFFLAGRLSSPNPAGTWLNLTNTSTGGGGFQFISTGSGNGEGANKLLIGTGTGGGLASIALAIDGRSGNVGLGTSAPAASAALDIAAAGKGLLIPRLDSAARVAIASPATGLLVFQTNGRSGFWYYGGDSWRFLPDKARTGDNLGSHQATQALNLGANALLGSGASLGAGQVGIGVTANGGLNIGQHTAGSNIYLGYASGQQMTSGQHNLFSGWGSGASNTAGDDNTFVGYSSGFNNTTGSGNTFVGLRSGQQNDAADNNTFIGYSSGQLTTTGQRNTFTGSNAGRSNLDGRSNTFNGYYSGVRNTSGDANTFAGYGSGLYNSTGNGNTFLGAQSGETNTTGQRNTFIGFGADAAAANLANATAIGYRAQVSRSNSMVLGGTGTYAVNVGIGTTAPAVPLDVQATSSLGLSSYVYLSTTTPTVGRDNGGGSYGVSIRASGRVVAPEFNALSDARLKHVLGRSDNAADLRLLQQLRVTDYQLRDRAQAGNRRFKKVLAQEVEQVFPQAVTQQTGFLPDLYAAARQVRALPGDSLLALTLPRGLAAAAAPGQRLKLLGPQGEVVAQLAQAAPAGATTLVVRGSQALAATPSQVFVFGFEHADVRAVDYEALAMLNVSATQELACQLAELQHRTTTLEAQARTLQADHATLEALQAQVARLTSTAPTASR